MQTQKQPKILTPHAAVIIWNYEDRIDPDGSKYGIDSINQRVINTLSLLSIKTNKTKSSAAGTFEIVLAPTKDWVSFITPGSWLCILMSQNKITSYDLDHADPKKVKMFGRIDSVRVEVKTNQETGARQTVYTVIGSDWAQVFDTTLYVDPTARDNLQEGSRGNSEVGMANRMLYNTLIDQINTTKDLPTSTKNIRALIDLWGKSNDWSKQSADQVENMSVLVKPDVAFSVPEQVFKFFGGFGGKGSRKLVDILNYKTGILSGYDTYAEVNESVGYVRPDGLFGTHSMWQVLTDNCNDALNELVADMRWDGNTPSLALYKRVRPFCIRSTSNIVSGGSNVNMDFKKNSTNLSNKGTLVGSENACHIDSTSSTPSKNPTIVTNLISRFENVRRITIPLDNIFAFNAGTNWRDKFNYVEILIDKQLVDDVRESQIKADAAIYSGPVFSREGFRPIIVPVKFLSPGTENGYNIFATTQWKYLLKEWYFDTHNMLNGTVTFAGINDYIQVGDNVIMNASVIGKTNNINKDNMNHGSSSYILAHVETVSHSFTNNPETAARSYFTTVSFVRGIITDSKGKQFKDGRLQVDASSITPSQEKNSANVFGTSDNIDPDPQKVHGT